MQGRTAIGFGVCILAALIILALGKGMIVDLGQLDRSTRFLFSGIFEPLGQVWLYLLGGWFVLSRPSGKPFYSWRVGIHSFAFAVLITELLTPFTVGKGRNLGRYLAAEAVVVNVAMVTAIALTVWWLWLVFQKVRKFEV
jgi:hypothetical protein